MHKLYLLVALSISKHEIMNIPLSLHKEVLYLYIKVIGTFTDHGCSTMISEWTYEHIRFTVYCKSLTTAVSLDQDTVILLVSFQY